MSMQRLLLVLWLVASAAPVRSSAQQTTLALTGFPVAFTTPTGADFVTGSIQSATATTYTVDATSGATSQRTTTVSVRCRTPCPASGAKALSTLQWRRADLGAWTTLTTTDVFVEQRAVFRNGANDPWSNSVLWRFLLGWTTDPPMASTRFNVVFTLTVTAP
jgi:hypothetical protein